MVKKITLIVFDPGEIAFPILPLMTTDFIQLGYNERKENDILFLTIMVKHWKQDTLNGTIFEIALAHTEHKIETDGKLTVDEIYPACENAVRLLRDYINQLAKIGQAAESNIHSPSLEHERLDLKKVVDFFLSNLN